MPIVNFSAPIGTTQITLRDGTSLPVSLGAVSADSRYSAELQAAGFVPLQQQTSIQQKFLGNDVVLLGDSIFWQSGGFGSSFPLIYVDHGIPHWMQRRSGKLDIVRNSGVSGNTTKNMLDRLQSDVFAYPSSGVIMMGGTNDAQNSVSPATTLANLKEIAARIRDSGRYLMFMGPPPRSWNLSTDNAALSNHLRLIDTWRNWAMTDGSIHFLGDAYDALVDGSSGNSGVSFSYQANMSAETVHPFIHPNNLGAFTFNETVLLPRLNQLLEPYTFLPESNARVNAYYPNEIQDDPMLLATPVAATGTGTITGTVPTGITAINLTGTGSVDFSPQNSIRAGSAARGKDLLITIAATSAGSLSFEYAQPSYAARVAAVNANADCWLTAGGWSKVISASANTIQRMGHRALAGGGSPPFAQLECSGDGTNQQPLNLTGLDLFDITPKFYLGKGVTFPASLRVGFSMKWNGASNIVLRVGAPFMRVRPIG